MQRTGERPSSFFCAFALDLSCKLSIPFLKLVPQWTLCINPLPLPPSGLALCSSLRLLLLKPFLHCHSLLKAFASGRPLLASGKPITEPNLSFSSGWLEVPITAYSLSTVDSPLSFMFDAYLLKTAYSDVERIPLLIRMLKE